MEMEVIWSSVLTGLIGIVGWWAKTLHSELSRVQILLNRTREEMAKEYVTKIDNSATIDRVMVRFDRLDEKIDRLMEK
tara:strand:- start:2505 stop:2738 length:234 start_codon:yes stop_codon:yes gene_type:complete